MAKTPAKKENTQVAVPDDLDIFADANLGNENVGQNDIVIPRIQIAQALSPEIKKTKSEYIEGAEEGSVFNTATRQLYTTPLLVVPVAYNRRYIEWIPRSAGGGLVNPDHDESILEQCERGEKGGYVLPNGNEIVDTPEHFVLVVNGDSYEQAVMSMAGTKAKVSRQWNTLIRNLKVRNPSNGQSVNPARFYGSYLFEVVPESNDQGDWMNWKVRYNKPTLEIEELGTDLYREARNFYALIREGNVKAEVEDPNAAGNAPAGNTDAF